MGGRRDCTTKIGFLECRSHFSALYVPDEGLKDAGTVPASFNPSSDAMRALEVDQKSRKPISGLPVQDPIP